MLTMTLFYFFAKTITLCNGAACKPPNGTENHFTWKTCADGPVMYHNLSLLDEDFNKIYPIHATKPFIISADITNTGEKYDQINTYMTLYKWGGWFSCSWNRIPAFGILDNLVQCDKGIKCPIKTGKQQLPIMIDLSGIRFFIKFLPDEIPYKIQFEIVDSKKDAYSCIELWSLIKTTDD